MGRHLPFGIEIPRVLGIVTSWWMFTSGFTADGSRGYANCSSANNSSINADDRPRLMTECQSDSCLA